MSRSLQATAGWIVRLLVMLVMMTTIAGIDLSLKQSLHTPPWAYHHRGEVWFVGCCLLLVLGSSLALVPSKAVVVGAGVFCGGLLGNLLSASADDLTVPNPFLIGHPAGIAFNLADVSIVTGNLLMMTSFCYIVICNRERLRDRNAVRRVFVAHLRRATRSERLSRRP